MHCPKCNRDSRVTETRTVSGNMLRRRRVCLATECNYRFTTVETIVVSGTKHNDAVVVVLPKHVARELHGALALLGRHLGLEETHDVASGHEQSDQEPGEVG